MVGDGRPVIAFVLYSGITPLDLIGPLQILSSVPDYHAVVVAERIQPYDTEAPVQIVPGATFDEVSEPSVLLVPGGGAATIQAMADARLRDYVVGSSETAEVVGSICTGSLILAAANLLDGRSAATHWAYHEILERLGARYVNQRWVEDGKFITSAGVSAGIDMALHLAARLSGEPMARYLQLWAEYDPDPPFGPIDWSQVDRDVLAPRFKEMRPLLADRPDLLTRLGL